MQAHPATIFITGATGFIGQRLVSALLGQDIRVRAMIRPNKESDSRLPPECEQIPVGLVDVDKLAGIVAECSAVVYCAGSVRGRIAEDFSFANIKGVEAMLKALGRSDNPPPFLLLSSLAASRPELSDYANSKYAGEQLLKDTALAWTILRPPAVYGPGDREMLPVFKMIRRGFVAHAGPSDQRLSLLHVDDLVNAVVTWISAPQQCLHQTYAIDDGEPGGYDWAAIGECVGGKKPTSFKVPRFMLSTAAHINLVFSRFLGYAPMLSPGKVRELVQPEWLGDNTAFSEATGWRPKIDLTRGAQQLFNAESEDLSD